MTTEQRQQVRQSLIERGFLRTGYTDDLSGVGDYTETWTHPDGTTIDLTWAPRDQAVQPVRSAPGMYDEPDDGLTFGPMPLSEEEDRIPSGAMTPAQRAEQARQR